MDILNAETISSRLFNCDLLLAILKEEPKPIIIDFGYENECQKNDTTPSSPSVRKRKALNPDKSTTKKAKLIDILTDTRLNDVSNTLSAKHSKTSCSYEPQAIFQMPNNEAKQRQHHQQQISDIYKDFFSCLENFVYSPPEEFDNINSYYLTDEKALLE